MDAAYLQDRISWGLNVGARNIGISTDAYRPQGACDPLDKRNRFLRLPVAFTPTEGGFSRSDRYGNAVWHCLADAAYLQPGDYLVRSDSTWFVADTQPLLPILCVRTNRTVSFIRPMSVPVPSTTTYSGVTTGSTNVLMTNWPASVMSAGGGGSSSSDLPSDTTVRYWTVLVPSVTGVVLLPSDIMSDDLGRNAVVAAAELTSLGWRINVMQEST